MGLRRLLACGATTLLVCAAAGAWAAPPRAVKKAQPAAAQAPADGAAPTVDSPASPPTAEARPVRPMGESVAATVNGEIISTYDLRQRIQLVIASTGVQPTEQNLPEIEREALRGLIDERLQMAEIKSVEARQKGIKLIPTDKEVDEEIDNLARQYHLTGAQLQKSLAQVGIAPATLRAQTTAQLAWQRYIGGRFRDNVHVGDEQVNAYLARFNADAAKPQYLVSEVFIDAQRAGGAEAALQGATQLVAQLRQGAPFAAVARQFSSLPSAANGGDEGWLVEGQIPAALQPVLPTLKTGAISDPIPTSDGVYIVALREKRAGGTGTMVKVQQAAVRLDPAATPAQVAEATAKLDQLKAVAPDCAKLSIEAAKIPGVAATGDLGETNLDELAPAFKAAVADLKPGQIGGPVRTSTGLNLIALCGRRTGGAQEPSRQDVENRLYGEQITMIARRYLRDLRNSASIESR